MKKVLILGRGPSLDTFKSLDVSDIEDVILMNNHEKTLEDQESLEKLKDKNIYVMWGVIEDRIFNHDIGFGVDVNDILFGENFSTRFDSSNSYMRYDKNLFDYK